MVVVAADADTVEPPAVLDIVGSHVVVDMALAYKLVRDRCLAQHFHLVEQARNSDPTTHMSEARPVDTYMVGTLRLMVVEPLKM